MLASITHFLPLTTIRRTRLLPAPGRVVARKGQKVAATDVIAEAKLAREHLLLDIARGLGVPASQADAYIQRHAGDDVEEGDVIAGPIGVARRVVRAPKNGQVVVAGGGQVLLELESPPFELRAGTPGVITELVEDRGVVIEATGALVQGVWGNGRIDFGLLGVLVHSPQDRLSTDRLDVSQRGTILLGGYCGDAETLSNAADIPIRGLILGSMDSGLAPLASKVRYPILITEGFGNIPMNSAAYKLLSTSDRREVAINAETWDPIAGTRPEAVIPLPASGQPGLPGEAVTFTAGQKVRVVGILHKAPIGVIVSLRPGLTTLANGVKAPAADIRLESGESVVYPLANLEVLE
jgi:hypothetical protein